MRCSKYISVYPLLSLTTPMFGLHCVLVPYLSLPCEQLKIGLGGSLSLFLYGSQHYASLIPSGVLMNCHLVLCHTIQCLV